MFSHASLRYCGSSSNAFFSSATRLHSYFILRVVGICADSWNSPDSHVSLGNMDVTSTWGVPTGMVSNMAEGGPRYYTLSGEEEEVEKGVETGTGEMVEEEETEEMVEGAF
jgi:hypothetical protein